MSTALRKSRTALRLGRKFLGMPLRDKLLLLRVLWWTALVEVGVRTVPLPKLAHRLGVRLSSDDPPEDPHELTEAQQRHVLAVQQVIRRWHLAPGPCLRESLVIGHLFRDEQPVLRIGVLREDGELKAHAWLDVRGLKIGELPGYLELPFDQVPVKPVS